MGAAVGRVDIAPGRDRRGRIGGVALFPDGVFWFLDGVFWFLDGVFWFLDGVY